VLYKLLLHVYGYQKAKGNMVDQERCRRTVKGEEETAAKDRAACKWRSYIPFSTRCIEEKGK